MNVKKLTVRRRARAAALVAWVDQTASDLDWTQLGLDDPPQGPRGHADRADRRVQLLQAWRTAVVCKDSWDGSSEHDTDASWNNIRITATQVGELHTHSGSAETEVKPEGGRLGPPSGAAISADRLTTRPRPARAAAAREARHGAVGADRADGQARRGTAR
jgi:hypothetical protein